MSNSINTLDICKDTAKAYAPSVALMAVGAIIALSSFYFGQTTFAKTVGVLWGCQFGAAALILGVYLKMTKPPVGELDDSLAEKQKSDHALKVVLQLVAATLLTNLFAGSLLIGGVSPLITVGIGCLAEAFAATALMTYYKDDENKRRVVALICALAMGLELSFFGGPYGWKIALSAGLNCVAIGNLHCQLDGKHPHAGKITALAAAGLLLGELALFGHLFDVLSKTQNLYLGIGAQMALALALFFYTQKQEQKEKEALWGKIVALATGALMCAQLIAFGDALGMKIGIPALINLSVVIPALYYFQDLKKKKDADIIVNLIAASLIFAELAILVSQNTFLTYALSAGSAGAACLAVYNWSLKRPDEKMIFHILAGIAAAAFIALASSLLITHLQPDSLQKGFYSILTAGVGIVSLLYARRRYLQSLQSP